jgi:hypothetical protein
MYEDLGLDGKIKTSQMGSGTGQWAHTLMLLLMMMIMMINVILTAEVIL